ncbi:SH3 domain-containing protein [Bartonella sp. F02]|uniref:SH3 domain-containing protein n=1 Tax=Bartonella sp. F02 TaxID=2967262 RepID=UPI0022A8E475|nr:SH3 domain-containing protein [Bartonella sp. F02]MCZ2328701.1 SH3 domain-containing protein [Bartonella sp. F02]
MKKIAYFFVLLSLFFVTIKTYAANAIVTTNLNFRAGPSTYYTLRGLIPAGQSVLVHTCSGNWCQISYNTQKGWVSAHYLSFKNSHELYRTYTLSSSSEPLFNSAFITNNDYN